MYSKCQQLAIQCTGVSLCVICYFLEWSSWGQGQFGIYMAIEICADVACEGATLHIYSQCCTILQWVYVHSYVQ